MMVAYAKMGDTEKMLETGEQSLALCKASNQKGGRGELASLVNLGNSYKQVSQYQKALTLFQEAAALGKLIKDKGSEGKAYHGIAATHSAMKNFDKAVEYYEMLPVAADGRFALARLPDEPRKLTPQQRDPSTTPGSPVGG